MSPQATQPLPRLPERYHDLQPLGEGSMGSVYRAYDIELQELVAIKLLRTQEEEDRRFLEREIGLLSKLRHENIVRLFDLGTCGAELFYSMELVQGISLEPLLLRGAPEEAEIRWSLTVALEVLRALEYLHVRGWIHGDVKPSNIMVAATPATLEQALLGKEPVVKLLDFGLARQGEATRVGPGSTAGTPLYMSPEQLAGAPGVDGRADVYSLGAVLHHLIAKRPPFSSMAEIRSAHVRPQPLQEICPGCPVEISTLVLRFLGQDPHLRPASAQDAHDELLLVLEPHRRGTAVPTRLLPPVFVGRRAEFDALREHLTEATRGEGRCVRILGERGIGKTWLLDQSGLKSEAVLDLGMGHVRGRFLEGGGVHQGLREPFQEMLRLIAEEEGEEALREALHPWGGRLTQALGLAVPGSPEMVARVLAEEEDEGRHAVRVARERLFAASLKVLATASRIRPLLVTVEDLHHADELEVEILARLARVLAGIRVALVVTCRPESVRPSSPLGSWLRELDESEAPPPIVLGGFTDHEVKELAQSVLRPDADATPRLVSVLARESEGKPLAVVRCLQALWESGDLQLQRGAWSVREGAEVGMPSSQAAWAGRLRALESGELSVLAAAVVLAAPFEEELLARLLEAGPSSSPGEKSVSAPEDLRGRIRSLVHRGLLTEGPEGLAVPPDFDERSLLELFSTEEIRVLHSRAGPALLERYGDAADSHFFHIATHFLRSGSRERARELFLSAARYAARTYANQRGIDAYHKAMELCEGDEAKRETAEELGELCTRVGDYPVALECFSLADSLAAGQHQQGSVERSTVRSENLALLDKIGRVLHRQGELAEALAVFSRCLEKSGEHHVERAKALFRIGGIHLDRGDAGSATRYLEESLKIYRELGDFRKMAAVLSGLGLAEKSQDHPEQAVARFEEALENAEKSGDLLDVAMTLNNLGNIHRARGDDHRALQCLRRSTEARERVGDRQGLAVCYNNIARVQAFRGELAAAASATEEALGIFEEIGDKKGVLIARSNLGELAHMQGDFPRAESLYRGNLKLAEQTRIQQLLETNLCNLAELELDRHNHDRALEHVSACLAALPTDRPLELRSQALGTLGAIHLGLGRTEEAGTAIAEAVKIAGDLELREKLGVLVSRHMRLHLQRGDPEEALRVGKPFLTEMETGTDKYSAACFSRELGSTYRDLGPDWADLTEKHLLFARRAFESMGSPHNVAAVCVELAVYWRLQDEEEEAQELLQCAEDELRRVEASRRLEELLQMRNSP